MPVHQVQQGECLASIAKLYGFSNWKTIYDHAANSDLRRKRKNPNVLLPGDTVVIPDRVVKVAQCATDSLHTFKLKRPGTKLRLVLKDADENPIPGKKYRLEVAGASVDGQSGGDGLIEQPIPEDAPDGRLTIWIDDKTRFVINLKLGHLDPADAISGAHSRLRNLGFDAGLLSGSDDANFESALRAFQKKHRLAESGQLDGSTKSKLEEKHDQP